MQFKCVQCGSCCKRMGEIVKAAPELEAFFQPDATGACRHLVNKGFGLYECAVYDTRPELCRVDSMVKLANKLTGVSVEELYAATYRICLCLKQTRKDI